MRNVSGKVAVVTGAGSGIGRATGLALARAGAVVVACDIDEISAKETAARMAAVGAETNWRRVDVSSENEMRGLAEDIVNEFGLVDIVVNNAGIITAPTPTLDVPLDRWRRVMEINYWGVVYGSLAFLPHLLRRPEANLVNVSSNMGLLAYSRQAPYASSKFAVRGFTEVLRMELRPTPVRVTVVCPGATKTPMMGNSPVIDAEQRVKLQSTFDNLWSTPPEKVADAIVDGIRRNRPRVLTGPDTRVIDLLVRAFPGAHSRLLGPGIDAFMNKVLGK